MAPRQSFIGSGPAERLFRPNDRVLVPQGPGEPEVLTTALVAASRQVPGLTACIGLLTGETLLAPAALRFESYGLMGRAAALAADAVDLLPLPYSDYIRRIEDGRLPCDVVLVRLSPAAGGRHYLGFGDLHLIAAARRARLVLAQIDGEVPVTAGAEWPADIPFVAVEGPGPAATPPPATPDPVELAIAGQVAALIPDRAVIQLGIGRLPQAITRALCSHRDLGVHSGALIDGIADLAEAGCLTNAAKEIDRGVSVGGVLIGGARLAGFAANNPALRLAPASHTHDPAVLAGLSRFHAINAAVEVDLFGQVNAEEVRGRRIGGIGGQVDFARGAAASPGGRSIVALPATAGGGRTSRIVPRVAAVSLAKSDVDVVVTEWGVAELAAVPPDARAERLIAIADPRFREDLARSWHTTRRQAHAG